MIDHACAQTRPGVASTIRIQFERDPDTMRAPDSALASHERRPPGFVWPADRELEADADVQAAGAAHLCAAPLDAAAADLGGQFEAGEAGEPFFNGDLQFHFEGRSSARSWRRRSGRGEVAYEGPFVGVRGICRDMQHTRDMQQSKRVPASISRLSAASMARSVRDKITA